MQRFAITSNISVFQCVKLNFSHVVCHIFSQNSFPPLNVDKTAKKLWLWIIFTLCSVEKLTLHSRLLIDSFCACPKAYHSQWVMVGPVTHLHTSPFRTQTNLHVWSYLVSDRLFNVLFLLVFVYFLLLYFFPTCWWRCSGAWTLVCPVKNKLFLESAYKCLKI